MIRYRNAIRALALAILALFIIALPSAAVEQQTKKTATQLSKRTVADKKTHRLVMQVNTNDPALMNLALNNATNVEQYYKDVGEKVSIEIVTFGPGLHMLRDDTSPVKARIKSIAQSTQSISFKACGNTQANMSKAEDKEIPLVAEAKVVKSGVVQLMQLQEQGWTYVRP
jgi:intracellular sulfur oxidation DsrE/DsrF family protein